MKEYAETAGDQLSVIRQWLEYMEKVEKNESYSMAELIEVDAVYSLIKDNEY